MVDRATVFGLAGIVALLLWGMLAGAGYSADVFWRTPSLALVIGGSVLATMVASPEGRFRSLGLVLKNALYDRTRSHGESILALVALATIARREGMLALDRRLDQMDDEFLRRALGMAIDGVDPSTIDAVMRTEMESIELRHTYGRGMLELMGRFAPVFGMIGTVIGLVVMLGRMNDPTMIGSGMAVALLTTLYGLVFANVICIPLARKLGHRSSQELLNKTLLLKGVLAIQAGDHPRMVEQKLRAYLPGGRSETRQAASGVSRQVEPAAAGSATNTSARQGDQARRNLVEAA